MDVVRKIKIDPGSGPMDTDVQVRSNVTISCRVLWHTAFKPITIRWLKNAVDVTKVPRNPYGGGWRMELQRSEEELHNSPTTMDGSTVTQQNLVISNVTQDDSGE